MAHFSNYDPNFHDFGLIFSDFAFRFYVAPAPPVYIKYLPTTSVSDSIIKIYIGSYVMDI